MEEVDRYTEIYRGGGGGGPDICGPEVCPEQMTRGVYPTSASNQHDHLLCALGLGFGV